jgi:hypothetical protein
VAAERRLPSVVLRSGVSPRSFLAPRTVAASRSRRSSTARSCRLPSCRSRAHPLRRSRAEDPVGLSRRGRRPTPARAVGDDVLRLVSLHALVGSSASIGGPTRLPRAVRVERGPRELGRLRLAAARAALTALTAGPPTWACGGVDPGRFRPMCATHDFVFKVGCPMSRLTPPRSHAVGGTPGFTPERRFGELALHVRAFLPGASCAAYL